MSLADAMAATGELIEDTLVPSPLTMVFATPPQAAPKSESLPAAFVRPTSGVVSYTSGQRWLTHTLEIVVLVERTANLPTDYAAVLPLLEPFLTLFEGHTSLDSSPIYYDAKITGYEIGPAGFNTGSDTGGDAQYVCLFLTMTVKEKLAVTMN